MGDGAGLGASPGVEGAAVSRPSDVFVGREREMAVLTGALDSAVAGDGRLVLVTGEPGIGKTRLIHELARTARRRGAIVAWGRSWEGGGAPVYWPWIQIVRSLIDELGEEVIPHLSGRANLVARIVPEVSQLAQGTAPILRHAERDRFVLFDAVASFLRGVANDAPLALILDDVHWADEASLHLLHFVARSLRGARILLLVTYIPAPPASSTARLVGKVAREGRCLELGGLDKGDVGKMFEHLTGDPPPQSLLSVLYAATVGNPLFVDEAVRLLDRDQTLTRPDHSLGFRVPEGAREVLDRRLAPLSGDVVRVASIAAVIGREFEFDVLKEVADVAEDELAALLRDAAEADVVKEVGLGRYRFSHPLLRETLYERLTSADRMRLHRDIGEVLEERYRDPEPHLAELAHHFFKAAQAGYKTKTIEYCVLAAEKARAALAYEEAVRLYERALKVAELANVGRDQKHRIASALEDARAKAGAAERAESREPSASEGDNVFRREGEYWTVGFTGQSCRLKDSKGLRYLAELLRRPGHEVHVLDLVRGVQGGATDTGAKVDHGELTLGELGDAGEILDATAKAQYKRRLEDLREELEEAEAYNDPGRIERARAEMDALTEQLAAAVGLGGRDRKAASDTERARMSVGKAIRAAISRIEAALPALGEHLQATVKAGVYCSYTPDPRAPISWRL